MCMNLEGHDITLGSSLGVSGAMKPSHNAAGSLLAFRKIGQARGREGGREGKEGKAQGVRGEGEGAPRHGSLVPLVGADGEEGKSPPGQGREGSCGGGVVFGWGRKAFGMQASEEGRIKVVQQQYRYR